MTIVLASQNENISFPNFSTLQNSLQSTSISS
jgi:hypothetical protein